MEVLFPDPTKWKLSFDFCIPTFRPLELLIKIQLAQDLNQKSQSHLKDGVPEVLQ